MSNFHTKSIRSFRKYFFVVLFVVCVGLLLPGCGRTRVKDVNVVLIVIDTLRADHLPFYGYHKNTAPFMSELAERSTVFMNAFSASSLTSPATASIFTSLYPFQHGVLKGLQATKQMQKVDPNIEVNRIPEKIMTITEVLQESGFKTFGISDNLNIGEREGFHQGFDRLESMLYKGAETVTSVLREWHQEITGNGRYFLYIHYMDPHAPYHWRKPWYNAEGTEGEKRISAYDSEINYVDQYIKELYELYGWDRNTILIITADHGEGLWDHDVMGHGSSLHREQIHVPFLLLLPEDKTERKINQVVTTSDILPTVRGLLGLPASDHDEGVNLKPMLSGKKVSKDREFVFSHLNRILINQSNKEIIYGEYISCIYQNWHFMKRLPSGRFLFDLKNDWLQKRNMVRKESEMAKMLEDAFYKFDRSCKKYEGESEKVFLDKNMLEKLKSLGYIK